MDITFTPAEENFRATVVEWLKEHLRGEFETARHRGGPGDEHVLVEERTKWERELAKGGWIGVGWPKEQGGRGLTLAEQVIFHEEYARAGGPGRINHIGETLAGPTIIHFGTPVQQQRFLPGILRGEEIWCQGYSEPSAGSDLAAVKTRAWLDEKTNEWVISGQKVWTSLAHVSDWCFVLARTEPDSVAHKGLSYLLVPMRQPGIVVRPIRQLTGTAEFNEVFFSEARTPADNIVGKPGDGWKVAMGTLAFERGTSTLGQQMHFSQELEQIIAVAKRNGRDRDPAIRQRLADIWVRLQVMRWNGLRVLSQAEGGNLGGAALIGKLYWSTLHRDMGKLALDVLGAEAEILDAFPYELNRLQSMALFVRSDTIYAGTSQIQRNIIAERALGMPKEPKTVA